MGAESSAPAPAVRGRRQPRPSGEDRELSILATAERLLSEKTLAATSVDDLARGAGISRPTFYFYFPSKDAVLLTLLDRVVAEADAASAGAFADLGSDPRRRWREGIDAYHRTFRAHRPVTLACAELRVTNAEVRSLWARVSEGWVSRCAEAIDGERRRGAAPGGLPARDLAIALTSLNERALYGSLSGDGPAVDENSVVDVLLEIWLSAIYRPAPPDLTG